MRRVASGFRLGSLPPLINTCVVELAMHLVTRLQYPFHPLPTDFLPGVFARTSELFVWDDKQDKEHQNTSFRTYYLLIIRIYL
jgi:hypothetical protein